MHRTTLLCPRPLWDRITLVAEESGISAAEFIRESCLAAIYFEEGLRAGEFKPEEAPYMRARAKARRELRE